MKANSVLRWFFWVAFASFLLASISHVAYFFRAFEPQDSSWYWWAVAYAIAVSIDITIFLLSLTVAELRNRKVNTWVVVSVWIFIAGLAGLSWFINWEYAFQFASHMLDKPAGFGIVGMINPIVASCFQALAIAYTWISDKIAVAGEEKSAMRSEILSPAAETVTISTPEPLAIPEVAESHDNVMTSKYAVVKGAIENAIAAGEVLSLSSISSSTGVNYSTVRAYAPRIKKELGVE
jgi:hypothetical protein